MKISIITVFPEIYTSFLNLSLIKRSVEKGLVEFNLIKISDFSGPGKPIDEPTCGPGSGMIIKPEILEKTIDHCESQFGPGFKIFFTPQGERLDQRMLRVLADSFFSDNVNEIEDTSRTLNVSSDSSSVLGSQSKDPSVLDKHVILVCSRYEGIDERVELEYSDLSLSIGDYVLMGGDLPAQVFIEAFLRLLPGVVGSSKSVVEESFDRSFLDHPEYGLPVEWKGEKVPDVVLSGNHAAIARWREEKACDKTLQKRFDWLRSSELTDADKTLCKKKIPNHYVVLMHTDVIVSGKSGNTSIKTLDIHDISRCCATYGIENFFIVNKLLDQRKILDKFLEFWRSPDGSKYNQSRFEALKSLEPKISLQEVEDFIFEKEGCKPLIVTTSAKEQGEIQKIDYYSQGFIWERKRPIVFVFGTGQGLTSELVNKSDYILAPINGFSDYNHLSVRSAVAIVLDRFLATNPKKLYLELLKKRLCDKKQQLLSR